MAHYLGRPLLIWQGIVGELARVRVQHEGQHQRSGYWMEAKEDHPSRVRPPCEKYVACGGCPVMHLNAAGQEEARRALVRDALGSVGLSEVPLGTWTPSPDGFKDFRHVVKLGAGYSDHGHIRVGAWGRRSRRVVPIPKCPVAAPILRRTMASIAHHVIDLGLRPYDPEAEEGVLRCAVLRTSRSTGAVLITLVVGRRVRALRDLADRLTEEVSDVAGVWVHINPSPGNAILEWDEDGLIGVIPLVGQGTIEETLGGVTYRIGPTDFFQTNPAVAELLYQRTVERLDLAPNVPVIDLYCGVGGLALQVASKTNWVIGVEEGQGAVTRAREAARRNGLEARFIAGRVREVLPDLRKQLAGTRPVVVVNPARRGLEDGVVEEILALRPRQIGYISCNPRAMARDLAALQEAGFQVGEVDLFDMFPNTAHLECLVTVQARDADDLPKEASPRRARRRVVRR